MLFLYSKSDIGGKMSKELKEKKDYKSDTKRNNNKRKPHTKRSSNKATKYADKSDNSRNVPSGAKNDPAWYNEFEKLANSATNLTFNIATGYNMEVTPSGNQYDNQDPIGGGTPELEPGIAVLEYVPIYGVGNELSDPINKTALQLWEIARGDKSGTVPFESADLMMTILATDSILLGLAEATRVYGLLNVVSRVNRYLPRDLVNALGFDFDDFKTHKADFYFWLNAFVIDMSRIAIPGNFNVLQRHYMLGSNIYMDEPDAKASLYAFRCMRYWKYDDANAKLTSAYTINRDTKFTFEAFKTMMEDMLAAILYSSDFNTMNAYILNAYGNDSLLSLTQYDAGYATVPVYAEEILYQIHNANFAGSNLYKVSWDITENMDPEDINYGAIEIAPYVEAGEPSLIMSHIVDLPVANPSRDDILEATRFMFNASYSSDPGQDSWDLEITACGSEILCGLCVTYVNWEGDLTTSTVIDPSLKMYNSVTTSTSDISVTGTLNGYSRFLSKMNMAPILLVTYSDGDAWIPCFYMGDMVNVAPIQFAQLHNIHRAVLYSLFNISHSRLVL